MANLLCFQSTSNPAIYAMKQVYTADGCSGGFLAPHISDYASLGTLGTLFQTYFAFDEAIFIQIFEANLLVFVVGHGLGRLMQAWRKSY